MSLSASNLTLLEHLRSRRDADAQRRHLALRAAHTTALTEGIDSSSTWVVQQITNHSVARLNLAETDVPVQILDVGCGDGRLGLKIAHALALPGDQKRTLELHGVDSDPHRVAAARQVYETAQAKVEARVSEGTALNLPFKNDSFDVILMLRMLNQTGDIAQALAESARVLKPGGVLFVTTADIARSSAERSARESPLRAAHERIQAWLGFPPQLYRHSTLPGQRLNSENARDWLQPLFTDIREECYRRSLAFDGADLPALMELYVTGLMLHKADGIDTTPGVSAGQWAELYRAVEAEMVLLLQERGKIEWDEGLALIIAADTMA